MSDYQRDLQMPPVIGGAGAPYSAPPTEEALELPPVIGPAKNAGVGSPPVERPLELPPTVT